MINATNSSFECTIERMPWFILFVIRLMRSLARFNDAFESRKMWSKKNPSPKHHLHKTWIIDFVGAAHFLSLSVHIFLLLLHQKRSHNSKHPKICFIQTDNNKSFSLNGNNREKIRIIFSSIEFYFVFAITLFGYYLKWW